MNPGDTFLIPDGISTHLNLVLAVLRDGSVIVCHFTTRRKYSDNTCVIQPGEHSFVQQETVVRYDQAHICAADRVQFLESVITRHLEPLSGNLLARIRQGALNSPQTPEKIKTALRKN